VKPKKTHDILQEKGFDLTYNQLNNYLTQLRKKKFDPSTLSFGELESICIAKLAVPQYVDEPFIVSFDVHYKDDIDDDEDALDDGNKFRFLLPTKRLLKIVSTSTRLYADATYKLIWQGFPALIVGTTDYDRKLHPFRLAVLRVGECGWISV
jgi:hypothetical protein